MKKFNVPAAYRSPLISAIKQKRRLDDRLRKDLSPTLLDFGAVQVYLARHFGFCYGVENAIEISFRTVEEHPAKKIYLLSEMIHNPLVNEDLARRGVRFIMDTSGNIQVPFDQLHAGDIVIIPAFGTTLELEQQLRQRGLEIEKYDTTCPFVEKVWNRAAAIAQDHYTVVVHGKPRHEETRATFSHSARHTPTVVIEDMKEAIELAGFIRGDLPAADFYTRFAGRFSKGFDPTRDLRRIGVVNQTTMLASDTQAIADYLKDVMIRTFDPEATQVAAYFADTRDTLCYATYENQGAVYELLKTPAHFAVVIGGYNSSNTSHLVELCEEKYPTYFIRSAEEIVSSREIHHYNLHRQEEIITLSYLPEKKPVKILITSGASCPDALVEQVIAKIAGFYPTAVSLEEMTRRFTEG